MQMSSKKTHASVAKLVDATDSKSVDSNIMLVQVRPEVPKHTTPISGVVFYLFSNACTGSINTTSERAYFRKLSNSEIKKTSKISSYIVSSLIKFSRKTDNT